MNINKRWRSFRNTYLITGCVGMGIVTGAFLFQGIYYHEVIHHIHTANRFAANRERMWREATGTIPLPEHGGDSVDKLAALLKPSMVVSLAAPKTDALHPTVLPNEISAAVIPSNQLPDVIDKLDWCIFGTTEHGNCLTGGSFDSGFRTQIEDVLSGHLSAHLHQVRKVTYHKWPRWSLKDLSLLWLGISGLGYGISVLSDEFTEWKEQTVVAGIDKNVDTSYPNLIEADRVTQTFLITSPIAVAVTTAQNGPMHMWKLWSKHAQAKQAAATDAAFLADHPQAESLIEAREVLSELEDLDPKFKADPDIAKAIALAKGTVQKIEEIPEMIELDKAKIEATMLVRRLLPIKDDVDTYTTEHKQLMAEYHYPDMQRALRGLPSSPEETHAEVVSDEDLRRFLDKDHQ